MASDYRVATSHNVALGSLVAVNPQPRTDAATQAVLRSEGISGAIHEQGLYIALLWSAIFTDAEYQALLTQFGLGTSLYANVTVYVPNFEYVYKRYNGVAVRPQQGVDVRRTDYYIRDVTILVKNLTPTEQDAAAAITLGAATLAGTGTVAIAGAAAITLGAVTVVGTGTVA